METEHDFPTWYTESLKTTTVWCGSHETALLTKTDGTTFRFQRGTTFSLLTKGVRGFFKVTGFTEAHGPYDREGPAGLQFLEWNTKEWVGQDTFYPRSMTVLPGGVGRHGFIVDWNSVEPWTGADPASGPLEKEKGL